MLMKYETFRRIYVEHSSIQDLWDALNYYFKDKVIIQKGKNSHPNSFFLHQWIEGEEIECIDPENNIFQLPSALDEFNITYTYRIKEKEPTFLYQFAYLPLGCSNYEISEYMTEEEAVICFRLMPYEKILKTKKER